MGKSIPTVQQSNRRGGNNEAIGIYHCCRVLGYYHWRDFAGSRANSSAKGAQVWYIAGLYTGEVLPGQMDNFKSVAERLIANTEKEPGTLIYEWNFRSDQKTFDVFELYRNSDALREHVNHVVAEFGQELPKVQKEVSLMIYGSPDEKLKQALAGFNPTYTTPFEGFVKDMSSSAMK